MDMLVAYQYIKCQMFTEVEATCNFTVDPGSKLRTYVDDKKAWFVASSYSFDIWLLQSLLEVAISVAKFPNLWLIDEKSEWIVKLKSCHFHDVGKGYVVQECT